MGGAVAFGAFGARRSMGAGRVGIVVGAPSLPGAEAFWPAGLVVDLAGALVVVVLVLVGPGAVVVGLAATPVVLVVELEVVGADGVVVTGSDWPGAVGTLAGGEVVVEPGLVGAVLVGAVLVGAVLVGAVVVDAVLVEVGLVEVGLVEVGLVEVGLVGEVVVAAGVVVAVGPVVVVAAALRPAAFAVVEPVTRGAQATGASTRAGARKRRAFRAKVLAAGPRLGASAVPSMGWSGARMVGSSSSFAS